MPRLGLPALAPGEMRAFLDYDAAEFAGVRCLGCGRQATLTQRAFLFVANNPDSALTCRDCGCRFHPRELLGLVLPPGQGVPSPRDGRRW